MERRLLTLLAETPVHAGGPESLAAVDLPIQREAATGLPVIWGQSLKGALRQAWRDAGLDDEVAAFGSRPPRRADSAAGESAADDPAEAAADDGDAAGALTKGAISVGDAQLLLFPAATSREVFGWVSTPLLLSRLGRKLRLLGADPGAAFTVTLTGGYGQGTPGWAGSQVIGPFLQNVRADAQAGTIGAALARLVCPDGPAFGFTRQKMSADLLLIEDSTMTGLARMGTDVVARVQLKEESKTVAHGPFYSEHLPAETVLAALLAGAGEHLDRLAELLDGQPIQLGGDETIGKGVLWCRVHSAASSAAMMGPATATESAVPAAPPPATPRPITPSPPANRPTPATIPGRKRG
ncbi:MAG: type III-B CRISPR module RAMP protein Cmr4 [Pseudonocardiaceae bacterium]